MAEANNAAVTGNILSLRNLHILFTTYDPFFRTESQEIFSSKQGSESADKCFSDSWARIREFRIPHDSRLNEYEPCLGCLPFDGPTNKEDRLTILKGHSLTPLNQRPQVHSLASVSLILRL